MTVKRMKCGLFSSIVLLALGVGLDCASSTGARSYPVCLTSGDDGSSRCDYSTMEQCRAAASGGLGECEADPFAATASDSRAEFLQPGHPHRAQSRSTEATGHLKPHADVPYRMPAISSAALAHQHAELRYHVFADPRLER
jgi:hypothetical protein